MRVLILGGTTEGYALAEALARDSRFAATYSLAGRTKTPLLPGGATRIGGFGGAQGLIDWMRGEKIDAIVDATHPYAARISANAVVAANALDLPLLRLQRPAWVPAAGDDWHEAADANAAVTALGPEPRTVFLTIGRTEVAAFRAAPQHRYLIRSVDAPEKNGLPPRAEVILHRGPFGLDDELSLMRAHGIGVVVSKNAGGEAAHAKIRAARQLQIPVVMIARPPLPAAPECRDVEAALAWLQDEITSAHGREPSERGV
ncbi:cobalt-precorrin-6A reductase [Hyphomicrobium sp. xq]|uniref:Cobalt-precorrin-6A reductase n=1 Tax=Hyphomicrobium album TaxID=2665159 RepID=A0A6I3KJZ4_9HYPH|nr:cobalt-precorrin-6A reductase [Hyphomicrobium album]MTD94759.1 cobalt-precorrin-6A reductase [Hyphomicrobium album]